MPETGYELKVGAAMLVLLAMAGAVVVMRDPSAISDAALYPVVFKRPAALKEGAAVRLSGQAIGVVRTIHLGGYREPELLEPGRPPKTPAAGAKRPVELPIIVDAYIRKQFADKIRQGSRFYIETAGVLGEAYLELDPGPADAPAIAPGTRVRGIDPPSIDVMMEQTYVSLKAGAAFLKEQGPELATIVDKGANVARTLEAVDPGFQHLERIQKNLARLQIDAAALGLAVTHATENGHRLRRLQPAAQALTAKVSEAVARERVRLVRALENLDALITTLDAPKRARIQRLVDEMLGSELARVEKLMADAQRLFKDLEGGRGTIGALSADSELFDELKALTKQLKQAPWKIIARPPGAAGKGP